MTANTAQRVAVQRPDNWSRNEVVLGACPDGPFTTMAQHDAIVSALLLQVAEQAAEIDAAREVLAKALDADGVKDEPLRMLAVRASNALYWRDQGKQDAERAREEAVRLLSECLSDYVSTAMREEAAMNEGRGKAYHRTTERQFYDEIAAFLAANGGGS